MRRKGKARALYIYSYRNYQCCILQKIIQKDIIQRALSNPPLQFLTKKSYHWLITRKKIVIYRKKKLEIKIYQSRCTRRFCRPCKISYGVRNSFFFCILWFRRVCKISHSVRNCPSLSLVTPPPLDFACYAKLLHVGFLPLVFFLASLIGLATYCQAWKKGYEVLQNSDSSCI